MLAIPERREMEINGINVSHLIQGSGSPFIMIHGMLSNSFDYLLQFREFSDRFTCIAPDLRGHGLTNVDSPGSVTFEHAVADMEAFCEAYIPASEKATLMGHSFGGLVALELLARMPGKFQRAIIAASPADIESDPLRKFGMSLYPLAVPFITRATIDCYFSIMSITRALETTPEAKELLRIRNDNITEDHAKAMAAYVLSMRGWRLPDFPARAAKIPVLAVGGTRDKLIMRNDFTRLKNIFPNFRLRMIRGSRHSVQHQNPEIFNGFLNEFIRET